MYRGVTRSDSARARSKFDAPMFEPEVFRKQMCCIEESTCYIAGFFSPSAMIQRPGISTPLLLSLIAFMCIVLRRKFYYFTRFPHGFESMKKHWFSKSAFKTLEKYWILPKSSHSNEKVWKFQIELFAYFNSAFSADDSFANIFALCSMYKIFKKWRWAMVIKFFHLVLKKYRKSFLKMCGSPDFNFSTFPAFVFFL